MRNPPLSRFALSVALFVAASGCAGAAPERVPSTGPETTGAPLTPPAARKVAHVRDLNGERFVDDYFWLRDKGTPEVEAYLRAEDAYADVVLAPLRGLSERLYEEIVSHIAEDDETAASKDGGWLSWVRTVKGKEHAIFLRREDKSGAPEQVVLDQNELAQGKDYLGLGDHDVDDGGNRLLFCTDDTGFRLFTLQFKDLRTGAVSGERIERTAQAVWASDDGTVFYTVQDDAKRPYRAYRHVVGADPKDDALVYEETDARFELYIGRTGSRAYMVLTSESKLSTEVRIVDARKPASAPVLVEPRAADLKYYVDHRGDALAILANDTGRNFHVATAPATAPGRRNWKELRPHDDKVMLESMLTFADHLALLVREGGQPHIEVYGFESGRFARVAVPEADHYVALDVNDEFSTTKLRYAYESLSTPTSTYELDMETMRSTLLKERPVPGGFDRTRYRTERVWATAKDGTSVPISLVFRTEVKLDGTAPLHLWAYGSYGFSIDSRFAASRLPLLDRGVIYAVAHVRGGGELGKLWHEQGRLANKSNTFTDFIACAEHLIARGYTSPRRLTIEGGSAGGLLIGAATNLRPDLFRAALNHVPFVDVINTMNDETLPMTVTEYEEWGNPGVPEQYGWIRAYSPYDNVERKAYPAMLVRSSYNDSQVMYWEPAKYVARMRALKTDENPLLFKIHMDPAGHGGKSGRYERFRDVALDQAFVLWQDGVAAPPPPSR